MQLRIVILLLANAVTVSASGSYYHRYAGQKLTPTAGSGLADLSSYVLSTTGSINHPAFCTGSCNILANCKTAQYKISTKECTLLSVSSTSSMVELVSDANFITFEANSATVEQKVGQTDYHQQILDQVNQAAHCPDDTSSIDLGFESDYLNDLAFTSSSTTGPAGPSGNIPIYEAASFNRIGNPSFLFCWAANAAANEWFKVDLQRIMWATRIRFQSSNLNYYVHWKMEHSYDDVNYRPLTTGSGLTKHVDGTLAAHLAISSVSFYKPILSRYWKITGLAVGPTSYRCMRIAIDGCPAECREAIGMETLDIEDAWVTSDSSAQDSDNPVELARSGWGLGGYKSTANGMSALATIVVDLQKTTIVTGAQIQGCAITNSWITQFRMQYKSKAGDPWVEAVSDTDSSPFDGCTDAVKPAAVMFKDGAIMARYVKFIPSQHSGSSVCWKAEVFGCKGVPMYATNVASGQSVTSTLNDSNPAPNMTASAATRNQLYRKNAIQDCAYVGTAVGSNAPERAMLTVDLGADKAVSSVKFSSPTSLPELSLVPDGLWLFDILHGGDDISGNGNDAIFGEGITYGQGIDGRPNGALEFPSSSNRRGLLIPVNNVGLDPQRGWTVVMWVYIDSAIASGPRDLSLFSFYIKNVEWGFNFYVRRSGSFHNNFISGKTGDGGDWWFEDGPNHVPFDRWVFIGLSLDCQGGIARQIVDKKSRSKRYYGCPNTAMPFGSYAKFGDDGAFVGRLSCLQVYKRGLDASEIEQASLCSWMPPAPYALYPLDCTLNDIQGNGPDFVLHGSPTCSSFRGLPNKSWKVTYGSKYLKTSDPSGGAVFGLKYSYTMLMHVWLTSSTISGYPFAFRNASNYNTDRFVFAGGGSGDIFYFLNWCPSSGVSSTGFNSFVQPLENKNVRLRYGRWMYLGITYDHEKSEATMWYDGQPIQIKTVPTSPCHDGPVADFPNFILGVYTGSISCFQIYNQALTRSQINSVRRCPLSGHVAKFNYMLDSNIRPYNLNNIGIDDLTFSNIDWGDSQPNGDPDNWSVKFKGLSNSYAQRTSNSAEFGPNMTQYTISVMAKNDETTGSNKPMVTINDASGPMLKLWQNPSGGSLTVSYKCNEGTVTSSSHDAWYDIGFVPEKWSHYSLCIYHNGAGTNSYNKRFRNGMELAWMNAGQACTFPTATALRIGNDMAGKEFKGSLACVAAFDAKMVDQYQAAQIAQCPTPSRVEGKTCESDLVPTSTISFSSTFTSAAGVVYDSSYLKTVWFGDASTAGSTACCWHPSADSTSEWIRADFGEQKIVTAIEMLGDEVDNKKITSFTLSHSMDGVNFDFYIDPETGSAKVFLGSKANQFFAYAPIRPPIKTRFLQLNPVTWSGGIGLRWAIRGCADMVCNIELFDASTDIIVSSATDTPAAMRCLVGSTRHWIPNSDDKQPYFQATFSELKVVNSILMQGSKTIAAWVKKYHLLYSYDTVNWQGYTRSDNGSRLLSLLGPQSGSDSPAMISVLNPPIVAKAIRIVIDEYNSQPIARIGIRGCSYSGVTGHKSIPRLSVRVGSTAPATATDADGQSKCGLTLTNLVSPAIPFGKDVTVTCSPPVTGRYVSFVSEAPGHDMKICQTAVFAEDDTNFAFEKGVTASSDITSSDAALMTDGDLATGDVGTTSSDMWLQVDLGHSMDVSRLVLVTHSSNWGDYSSLPWKGNADSNICENNSPQLDCPTGQVFYFQGAYYGQVFYEYCVGSTAYCVGRNDKAIDKTIMNSCHLKNNCTLTSSNAVWNEPCAGVAKTLHVKWMCIDPKDISPKLSILVGDSADASDSVTCDYKRLSQTNSYVPGESWTFHCTPPIKGRYIRIAKESTMLIKFNEIIVN